MRDALARVTRMLLSAWLVVTALGVGALGAMRAADLAGRVVTTGSMAPTIPADSLVLIGEVDTGRVTVGDVISYRRPENRDQLVLHRVVEVLERDDGRYFRTRGDANAQNDVHPVHDRDVVGRLRGHLPGVGSLVGWLQPPWGVVFLAGVPLLSLVVGTPRGRPMAMNASAPAASSEPDRAAEPPRRPRPSLGLRPAAALAAAAWTLGAATCVGSVATHQRSGADRRQRPLRSRARGGRANTNKRKGEER